MKRGRPEQILQTRIVARLRREFDCRVIHIASGGTRGRIEAIRLKEAGVEAGHPDLIAYGRDGACLHLEVKAGLGKPSREQVEYIADLRERGFTVSIVNSVEAAVAAARDRGFGSARPPAFLSRDAGGF